MTAPVLTDREIATRLLALRVLSDRIKVEDRKLREQASGSLMVGERVSGAIDPTDKETLLGFVQLTKPRETVGVSDSAAFLEWAKAAAPGEIVTTETVRSSFVASVLADVKSHGGWISPDGELLTPDGVQVTVGSPILTVKPTAEADALVAEAIRTRRLELPGGAS